MPLTYRRLDFRNKSVWAVAICACVAGCTPPVAERNRPEDSPASVDSDSGEEPESQGLGADQVAAIRTAIQNAGGTLACDASGQPVAIDLASGRVAADRQSFQAVLDCSSLKSLRLHAGQLDAADLNAILDLRQLEDLLLQEADLPETFFQDLAERLGKLRRLTVRGLPTLAENSLRELNKLNRLESLALIDLPITDEALRAVAELPHLRSVDLRQCSSLTPEGLRVLSRCADLEELKLSGPLAGNEAAQMVASFPALRRLTFEDGSIDATGLAALVENSGIAERLETLSIARCLNLTDEAMTNVARLIHLRHLVLRDVPVTGAFLAELPHRNQFETLALNQTFLDEQAFEALAGCRKLKRLELVQNLLTPEAIGVISQLSSLEYLDISQCGVDDDQIAPLAKLPHLTTLIAEGNPGVSAEMVRQLTAP